MHVADIPHVADRTVGVAPMGQPLASGSKRLPHRPQEELHLTDALPHIHSLLLHAFPLVAFREYSDATGLCQRITGAR